MHFLAVQLEAANKLNHNQITYQVNLVSLHVEKSCWFLLPIEKRTINLDPRKTCNRSCGYIEF